MTDLRDGERREIQSPSGRTYTLKNVGGVYSCSCPAWRNQSRPIDQRTCKHLKAFRGEALEQQRLSMPPVEPARSEGEGAIIRAPQLLLAKRWDGTQDLRGWWMSEKLDGVRAYWDGEGFRSRNGNTFFAPGWFREGLGDAPLDGELWIDRKCFQRTVSVVRRYDAGEAWREVRYVIFDAPAHPGRFEARMAALHARFGEGMHPFAEALEHIECEGAAHLEAELREIERLGGEGLMMRRPRSKYEVGRSASLLKIKSFIDAEARVIEHLPGRGKHEGRLGALRVELPNGVTCSVGTGLSDEARESPPAIGEIITFRYQELSKDGVPRFPSFIGVRCDVTWPPPPPEPRAPEPPPLEIRSKRLEFVHGQRRKFWSLTVEGATHEISYGRVGHPPRRTSKAFLSARAAQREARKLISSKLQKGYVEVDAEDAPSAGS